MIFRFLDEQRLKGEQVDHPIFDLAPKPKDLEWHLEKEVRGLPSLESK